MAGISPNNMANVIDGYGIGYICDNTARPGPDAGNYVCNCNGSVNMAAVGQSQGNANACSLSINTQPSSSSPSTSNPSSSASSSSSSASATPTYDPTQNSTFAFRIEGYWPYNRPKVQSGSLPVQVLVELTSPNTTKLGQGSSLSQTGPTINDSDTRLLTGSGMTLQVNVPSNTYLSIGYHLLYVTNTSTSANVINGK